MMAFELPKGTFSSDQDIVKFPTTIKSTTSVSD